MSNCSRALLPACGFRWSAVCLLFLKFLDLNLIIFVYSHLQHSWKLIRRSNYLPCFLLLWNYLHYHCASKCPCLSSGMAPVVHPWRAHTFSFSMGPHWWWSGPIGELAKAPWLHATWYVSKWILHTLNVSTMDMTYFHDLFFMVTLTGLRSLRDVMSDDVFCTNFCTNLYVQELSNSFEHLVSASRFDGVSARQPGFPHVVHRVAMSLSSQCWSWR